MRGVATVTHPVPGKVSPVKANSYIVAPVFKALKVLDFIAGQTQGASLTAVAASLRLPKTTAYRYLMTLSAAGYLDHDAAEDLYQVGACFRQLARADTSVQRLRTVALPMMTRLGDQFGETVNLSIRQGDKIIYIEMVESRWSLRTQVRIGDSDPVHSTALGKAILAFLPPAECAALLGGELPAITPRTMTDPEALAQELKSISTRGYATEIGENEQGAMCIGVPILDQTGRPIAALSASGPETRITEEAAAAIGEALLRAAAQISSALASRMSVEAARPAGPSTPSQKRRSRRAT